MAIKVTLWARDGKDTSALINRLNEFGYNVKHKLSGSLKPQAERNGWFYEGVEKILYGLTCGRKA